VLEGEKMKEWVDGSRLKVLCPDSPYDSLQEDKSFILCLAQNQGRHRSSPSAFPTSCQSPFYIWHAIWKHQNSVQNGKFYASKQFSCILQSLCPVGSLRDLKHLLRQSGLKALRFSWQLRRIIWLLLEYDHIQQKRSAVLKVMDLGSVDTQLFSRIATLYLQSIFGCCCRCCLWRPL
jgi:hypothetical protein